jgi:hypothetical protein
LLKFFGNRKNDEIRTRPLPLFTTEKRQDN